ncbi:hypothetical protein KI387_011891, partial [Taxus chinensis]
NPSTPQKCNQGHVIDGMLLNHDAESKVLLFDSLHGRTGPHCAANYGHTNCLEAIHSAGNSAPVADSWWAWEVTVRFAAFALINYALSRFGTVAIK